MSSSQMEEQNECEAMGSSLQDQIHVHRFYFVKFRPSPEELEREEAAKQYHLMTLARSRITEEIDNQKGDEHQINEKIRRFSQRDEYIKRTMWDIENLERYLGKVEPCLPMNSAPRTAGVFRLPGNDAPTPLKPDRKRCQKRLVKKERMDMEYLLQVQEELLSSKKSGGMTPCGTQELNDLIESMAQRIQHGNINRADEMKMYHEMKKVKETREMYMTPEPNPRRYWYSREIRSKRDTDWKRSTQHTINSREIRSKRDTDWKRSTQHTINIRLDDIERIKMDQQGRKAKVTRLKADLELVRKTIGCLQKELEDVKTKRLEAYKRTHMFVEQNDEPRSSYNEYQSLMTHAKEVARKGDVTELKQVCDMQVEGFMRQWNESKAFRDDYERRKWVSK